MGELHVFEKITVLWVLLFVCLFFSWGNTNVVAAVVRLIWFKTTSSIINKIVDIIGSSDTYFFSAVLEESRLEDNNN